MRIGGGEDCTRVPKSASRYVCSKVVASTSLTCLHIACTDSAQDELVACWHLLAADVRQKISEKARGQRDS